MTVCQVHARAAALLLVVALGAAACNGGGGSGEGTSAAGEDGAAAEQELTVGFTEDQYVLEGADASVGVYPLNTNVVETLVYLSPDYTVEPLLAERWEFIEPNTWRFHLKEDVAFHDGQLLSADAVKEGLFDRVAQRDGGGTIKAGPDSATVVDEHTIDFTPTVTNLRVPQQLVHPQNGVVAPGTDLTRNPVGTGPFRFVSYQPKERIVVERNADYWGEQAHLAGIAFRFYPDANARRLALESGDIDLAYEVPRADARALENKGFRVARSPVGAYEAMYANIHSAAPYDLLQDVRLRQAIAYAIDRDALIEGVLDGFAEDAQTWVPPAVLGDHAPEIEGYRHDPVRAVELLQEAGWTEGPDGIREKDGRALRLRFVSGFPSAEIHRPIPTFLQSELGKVGIDIDIIERPDSASFQALIDSGEGDLYLEQGNQNDANPGFLPVLLLYTGGSGATASYQSLFAPGPRFDELIEPSLTAVDPDDVQASVAAAIAYAIDEEAVVLPLAGIFRLYGMHDGVAGFTPHPSFLNVRWAPVRIDEE